MTLTARRLPHSVLSWLHATLLICVMALSATHARPAFAQSEFADPPGRVARLSDLSGQVWIYRPDAGEWIGAVRNQPLTTSDRLATDPGARAELQIGSTTLRLGSSSELEVVRLDDERTSLELHAGTVAARVRNTAHAGQLDLTTDEGRVTVQRAGRYRFDRFNGSSFVDVDNGEALYEGRGSALTLYSGQRAEFWIDANRAAQYSITAPVNDAFTAWNNGQDRAEDRSVAARYVSPEMTGAQDLDRYGRWENNVDYGSIWIPRGVAANWAPYSAGHWAWVRPWGWTWVDDAPWGFAPFHYGRWVYVRDSWGWAPGTLVARPVYAPAMVAWLGGSGVNVSISIGGGPAVGWVPLAPREVYVPSYRTSPRYAQNINITNVTNITNITTIINNPGAPREFDNRRFPRAVTVVPAAVLTERRPVAPAAAQWRNEPWARELAGRNGPAVALVAPLVAAPALLPRAAEPRQVLPPPGVARESMVRPGMSPERRTRDGAELMAPRLPSIGEPVERRQMRRDDGGRPERVERLDGQGRGERRSLPGVATVPPALPPAQAQAPAPAPATTPAPVQAPGPGAQRPARPMPQALSNPVVQGTPQDAGQRPPSAVLPRAVAPRETRDLLPDRRGDERRGDERRGNERRSDERREPARNEAMPPASTRLPQAVEPVAAPPRPAAVVPPPRPPAALQVVPPPQAKPPEPPRAPAEPPRNGADIRREERREGRRDEPPVRRDN